jgi:arsenite-transporting ATPase
MRLLIYTGKGGVGKTTLAAASALAIAKKEKKPTLVVSTDPAHSLSDVFDTYIGPEMKRLGDLLWAEEIDSLHELERNWAVIQSYLHKLLSWRGLQDIVLEELVSLPGTSCAELMSLLKIGEHAKTGNFEVIVIDCAPTGETLNLLAFPEVARWWFQHIFPIQRYVVRTIRPIAQPFISLPLPSDDVYSSVESLFFRLDEARNLLTDSDKSSIRLILTPEHMVIREAQRSFSYLTLFGFHTDCIICNRLEDIPNIKDKQQQYLKKIEEYFYPLPILKAPRLGFELFGQKNLMKLADLVFADISPSSFFFTKPLQKISKENGDYILSLTLPFIEKEELKLHKTEEELIIRTSLYKRVFLLPHALRSYKIKSAHFKDSILNIIFSVPEKINNKLKK